MSQHVVGTDGQVTRTTDIPVPGHPARRRRREGIRILPLREHTHLA